MVAFLGRKRPRAAIDSVASSPEIPKKRKKIGDSASSLVAGMQSKLNIQDQNELGTIHEQFKDSLSNNKKGDVLMK